MTPAGDRPKRCAACARPALQGRSRCDDCLKLARDRARALRAAGRCQCNRPAVPGLRVCERCREQNVRRLRKRYEERKAAGRCVHAGCREEPTPGRVFCKAHRAYYSWANRRR